MALAGLILGYVSVVFIPIILIIAAIAIPNLLRAKMAANEASAVGSLRVIYLESVNYNQTYGHGFPPSLAALGPANDGAASSAEHAGLIDVNLALGSKSGYVFTYKATSTRNDGTLDAFHAYADPVAPGTTGVRHFFVDQSGIIRYQEGAPADENSPPPSVAQNIRSFFAANRRGQAGCSKRRAPQLRSVRFPSFPPTARDQPEAV
ncbi:MAG TPA: hypothetical protein VGR81_04645 [Candidatus Acidoferrales bacterium]|nr:hypothetical protein [Candidatus Acidoferrales bacterium]